MERRRRALRQQLTALERELRAQALWQQTPPTAAALASSEPFCVDTLQLSEWLQWLMIPRLHALLDGNHPLPQRCNVLAIAEQSFSGLQDNGQRLLPLIAEIDALITGSE